MMRLILPAAVLVTLGLLAPASEPMRADQVKPGLFVVRGPFDPCAPGGCNGRNADDGLLHEPGDVAVRVTSEGAIVVDDKFAQNVPDVMAHVKRVTSQPIKYLLNSHHRMDHIGGNGAVMDLGIEVIAHKNIRDNIIRNKQPGSPRITFTDQEAIALGGVEVRMLYFGRGHTNGDTVIPGHGRILTRDDVTNYIPKLKTMNNRMRELVRRQVPNDQLQAQLKLDDIGWAHTVSTSTFMRSIVRYRDEIAAAKP